MDTLDRIETKLDKVSEDITGIKVHVAEQQVILDKQQISLDKHIKRTELLEKRVKPLEDSQLQWSFTGKFLSAAIGLGAALATIIEVFIK